MGSKTISVDVDIDYDIEDFDTDEIIEELINRIDRLKRRREVKEIAKIMKRINDECGLNQFNGVEIKTLDDNLKMAHLQRVWNSYPFYVVEERLPA